MAENKGILPSSTFNTLGNNNNKWEAVYANKLVGPLTGNVTGNVSGSSSSCTGNAATANNALKANGHTVNADVPANAKFTDTTYGAVTDSASGLMTAAQKKKLDSLSNYSLPAASSSTLGGIKMSCGTNDLTAGSSSLTTDALYFVYE